MGWVGWVLLALVVLTAAGWYLSFAAARLDRLHLRVETSRAVLDARLAERSGAAGELAGSGLLDPASAVLLAEAAHRAREAAPADREAAESELTDAAAAVLSAEAVADLAATPAGAALLHQLSAACTRAELARRFYNDAVAQALRMRRKRVVRGFRLAGHAEAPATVELDDAVPPALSGWTPAGTA
jgi:hypothetical protein